jgi:transposase InsO family protein
MQSVTRIPHARALSRGPRDELSEDAKFRLRVFDFYYQSSARFSESGKADAALTCRRLGIHRSYFYRWKARYDKRNLSSLEAKSTAPKKRREPEYSRELVAAVRDIRKKDPTYSAKKIRPILLRTMSDVPSATTLGRLINRENLFFRADTKLHKKRSNSAKTAHKRKRKPYNLKAEKAEQIIEFDMKHINLLGQKCYAFCAIDPFKKETMIHVASSPSSENARTALKKVIARFGTDIVIVNDNGSENMAKAEEYLASLKVTQYWARPKSPKDKPFVERVIGTLQRECLDYHYEPMNVTETQKVVDAWLDKYHFYRPHESLDFLTPAEFSATLGKPILTRQSVL